MYRNLPPSSSDPTRLPKGFMQIIGPAQIVMGQGSYGKSLSNELSPDRGDESQIADAAFTLKALGFDIPVTNLPVYGTNYPHSGAGFYG